MKVPHIQAVCLEYFLKAISSRKDELRFIQEHVDSFKEFEDPLSEYSELSVAIEEAAADIVDFTQGMTFITEFSEREDAEEDKVDPKAVEMCSEFYAQRVEGINAEIKKMENSSKLLKSFRGNTALIIINVLEEFENLLKNGLHALEVDSSHILSELKWMKDSQSHFYSMIVKFLLRCKGHFEENIDEIEHDIYILHLQSNILGDENEDMLNDDILSSFPCEFSNDLEYTVKEDETDIYPYGTKTAVNASSEESAFRNSCFEILTSAAEFRTEFIDRCADEIKSLSDTPTKAFQVLHTCEHYILKAINKREIEKNRIESILMPVRTADKADVILTCMNCLNELLQFNTDCLKSLKSDFERLQHTVIHMEQKRTSIFSFCEETFQLHVNVTDRELKNMHLELVNIECMQSYEVSEYDVSSKEIFQIGISYREEEISLLKRSTEFFKSETEILPVVTNYKEHLSNIIESKKQEIILVKKQTTILENEAAILLAIYASPLETIAEENKKVLEILKLSMKKLNRIIKEVEFESKKILQTCLKLYCGVLETLKLEKEAILHDLESLQDLDEKIEDIIDTEGKEYIVSFKDLFLCAFNLKKSDLEKDIRKRDMEDSVKMKKLEIIQSLTHADIEKETTSKETFDVFVQYHNIRKEQRMLSIQQQITKESDSELMMKAGSDSLDYEEDIEEEEEEEEEDQKVEEVVEKHGFAVTLVFEVKMKEVEEDIKYKKTKIKGVIEARKHLMEDIIAKKRKDMEQGIILNSEEMRNNINTIRGLDLEVVCTLKDLFDDILRLKTTNCESALHHKDYEKYFIEACQKCHISVNLENFNQVVLEVKELELQMLCQEKYKYIDKMVSVMKKELDRIIAKSNEKLEEAIKNYKKSEESRAMEYALSGGSPNQTEAYIIQDGDIFPDVFSFKKYIESFKGLFSPIAKNFTVFEDKTFHSEEILRNDPVYIPFFRKQFPISCFPSQFFKILKVEINSLEEVNKFTGTQSYLSVI